MSKRTAAAWIGITLALGTGMSLLRQTQAVVAAKPEKAATDEVERKPGNETQKFVAGEPDQRPDLEHTPTDVDKHARRTAMRSIASATLLPPPLPSRVLPGPLPTPEQAAPERLGNLLPIPPVPSKTLPGAIPESGQNKARALDETKPVAAD